MQSETEPPPEPFPDQADDAASPEHDIDDEDASSHDENEIDIVLTAPAAEDKAGGGANNTAAPVSVFTPVVPRPNSYRSATAPTRQQGQFAPQGETFQHPFLKYLAIPNEKVTEIDLDSLADKPWRKPGADLSDYFNYGFDERTWKAYCLKQHQHRLSRMTQARIKVYDSSDASGAASTDAAETAPPSFAAARPDSSSGNTAANSNKPRPPGQPERIGFGSVPAAPPTGGQDSITSSSSSTSHAAPTPSRPLVPPPPMPGFFPPGGVLPPGFPMPPPGFPMMMPPMGLGVGGGPRLGMMIPPPGAMGASDAARMAEILRSKQMEHQQHGGDSEYSSSSSSASGGSSSSFDDARSRQMRDDRDRDSRRDRDRPERGGDRDRERDRERDNRDRRSDYDRERERRGGGGGGDRMRDRSDRDGAPRDRVPLLGLPPGADSQA